MTFEEWWENRPFDVTLTHRDFCKLAYEAGKAVGLSQGDYMEGLEGGIKIGQGIDYDL